MVQEASDPRFVADVMLGRLARWLRLLGYDTLYDRRWDDRCLARVAAREQRILLTRDHGLLARRIVRRGLLVDADAVDEQLRLVTTTLGLHPAPQLRFSRCTFCNTRLVAVTRGDVAGRVPPYVLRTQERFTACPDCRRVYWHGTQPRLAAEHLRRMTGRSLLDAAPGGP